MSRPIRVLIVEDHRMVAQGLALLLTTNNIDVAAVAHTAGEARRLVAGQEIDVALLDHHLPDAPGPELAGQLREQHPHIAVVMLSADGSDEAMLAAIEAGACGYIVKTGSDRVVVDAIRRAAAGEILMPAETLSRLFALRRARSAAARDVPRLTPREREVLDLMAQGTDTPVMAERLGTGIHTVRRHVQNVLQKLDAHSKLEAVARARDLGLLK